MEEHIPQNRTPEDRGPTVVNTRSSSSTGSWAVGVILAVLVVVGVFYFAVSGGGTGDAVDPNANTSAIETPDSAPAETQPLETQPLETQPSEGEPAQ